MNTLRTAGAVESLEELLVPFFAWLDILVVMVLPIITKCIAGGTAMMGVAADFLQHHLISIVSRSSSFRSTR